MSEKKTTQLDEFDELFLQQLYKPEVLERLRAEGKIPPAKVQHISNEVKQQMKEYLEEKSLERERILRGL